MRILLASESVYRKELLSRLKVPFETAKPNVDEDQLKQNFVGSVEALSLYLAEEKAKSLISSNENGITIGCDQIAVLKGEILHKPGSKEKAIEQLKKLRGKSHELITALAVHHSGLWLSEVNMTSLTMLNISDEQIEAYVEKENPIDCAGAYKIESLGISLMETIDTHDFTAITGLPLMALCRILYKFNYPLLAQY